MKEATPPNRSSLFCFIPLILQFFRCCSAVLTRTYCQLSLTITPLEMGVEVQTIKPGDGELADYKFDFEHRYAFVI